MRFSKPRPNPFRKINDAKYSYSRDKRGWVTFPNGRKRMKLRAYVLMLAEKLTHYGESRLMDNRELLIKFYNKDGLDGVRRTFKIKLNEAVAKSLRE